MSDSILARLCVVTLLAAACSESAARPGATAATAQAGALPAAPRAPATTPEPTVPTAAPAPSPALAPTSGGAGAVAPSAAHGGTEAAGSSGELAADRGAGSSAGVGGAAAAPNPEGAVAPSGPSGILEDPTTGELVFRTDSVELPAGKESYVCFASTLDHDVVVDGFAKGMQQFVHHIQFVQTLLPEPEGSAECDVLFRITWLPIFLAGAGASELRLDEGVGHALPQGTQLMAQLHLLNASDRDIKQQVEIRMHISTSPNPTPVTPWAIGSSDIQLAPKQSGQAKNVCTVKGDVQLVAAFPHMHMLGTKLTVEVGESADAMKPFYARDPYDFDDQHMERFKASLKDGDTVRVTCDYMNTTDAVAQFGESSHDEMCFFIAYAIGDPPLADCPNLWDPVFAELLN